MTRVKIGRRRLYFVREGLERKNEDTIVAYAKEEGLKLIYHEDEIVLEGTTEQLYSALYDISERWALLLV